MSDSSIKNTAIKALSLLSAVIAEKAQSWREECERSGEEAQLPALLLETPEDGAFLVRAGEPVECNPSSDMLSDRSFVEFSMLDASSFDALLGGTLSPQSAVHSGHIQITGDSKASLFLTQLMADAWGKKR